MPEDTKEEEKLEFDSKEVAAYILYRCNSRGIQINATQIQKILYCCYGVVLALTGERLTKEHPQAWPYGPVFPRVFTALRRGTLANEDPLAFYIKLSPYLKGRIDQTIDFFSKFPAGILSAWSHVEGSPWYQATDHGTHTPARMDDEVIRDYFKKHVLKKGVRLDTPFDEPIMQ